MSKRMSKRKFQFDKVDEELTSQMKRALHKTLQKNLEQFNEEKKKYGYCRERITTLHY